MTERCEGCRYWARQGEIGNGALTGSCRRYPPVRNETGASAFPEAAPSSWCGEYAASIAAEKEAEARGMVCARCRWWDGNERAALGLCTRRVASSPATGTCWYFEEKDGAQA